MTPAIVLAGSRSDAVLCDCGEEIVKLYTFELFPGYTYYAIDGRLFELDHDRAEHMPVTRAEPIAGGVGPFNLITACKPLTGFFEFRAYGSCDNCTVKRFEFQVVDGVLSERG